VDLGSSGDLAFAPDGRLFGIGTDGDEDFLLRINPQTGAATIVGFLSDERIYGIAFSPAKALLAATENGELLRVNPTNAEVTSLGQLSGTSGINGLTGIRTLLAPVRGPFRNTGIENSECNNATGLWTFCQHQTGFHKPGGILIPASNETLAWDINLSANADKGLPVFAVAPGRIVKIRWRMLALRHVRRRLSRTYVSGRNQVVDRLCAYDGDPSVSSRRFRYDNHPAGKHRLDRADGSKQRALALRGLLWPKPEIQTCLPRCSVRGTEAITGHP
jgi:hypothetical protein